MLEVCAWDPLRVVSTWAQIGTRCDARARSSRHRFRNPILSSAHEASRKRNDQAAALAAVPKRPGAGPLPVMGDAIPRRQRPGADRRDAQRAIRPTRRMAPDQHRDETGGRLIGDIAVRADCDTRNWAIAWMVAVIRAWGPDPG